MFEILTKRLLTTSLDLNNWAQDYFKQQLKLLTIYKHFISDNLFVNSNNL